MRFKRVTQRETDSPLDVTDGRDAGMTLVELLIVLVIMPMIIGAIALALVTSLQDSGGVAARLSESSDAQTVAEFFGRDVESAASVTTSASIADQCGSGTTPLVGLSFAPNGAGDRVTYWEETVSPGPSYELVREFCGGSGTKRAVLSTTLQSSSSLSADIAPDGNISEQAQTQWASTAGISAITLHGVEEDLAQTGDASAASTEYPFDVVATPRVSTSASQGLPITGGNP